MSPDKKSDGPVSTPRLAVSAGDTAGIGPDVAARAASSTAVRSVCRPVLFWPRSLPAPGGGVEAVPVGGEADGPARGALASLVEAVCAVQQGRADALVTAPVHKGRMAEVVPGFSGHTEWLARRAGADPADVLMVFSGERVVTACVTRHVPLSRVAGELDERRIARAAVLLWGHVRYDLGRASARLAVCGVNPHASDGGLLGGEEARVIAPAVARAARAVEELDGRGSVTGPVAADAAFRAHVGGRYDAVLAMYHDQATVAAKLADPFRSVNVSVGLPFVRTSPDHGTADDIASSGGADPSSMETALLLAARIAARTGGTCARLDEIRRVLSQAT